METKNITEKTAARDVARKLSLRNKVKLLYGDGDWLTNGIPNTAILPVEMHDGPCGLRIPNSRERSQGDFIGGSIPATCFPAPCLLACSWDPSISEMVGKSMASEAIELHSDMILAPGVNIKRNPLCGRNFEYLSEDPLLSGKMGAGFINGAQSLGIGTSLKHFAANNQEYRRVNYSAEVDERALRDIYLKPFEIAIKEANPWTVMCSYNRINGVYSSDNDWLLKTVLRDEWHYEGPVISDWGAAVSVADSHNHGMDLEMPCHAPREKQLIKAVKRGTLSLEMVNQEAERIAGLSDKVASRKPFNLAFNYGMSHQAALAAAENSIVLAKNDDGVLPLSSFAHCCIIGALAKEPRYQGEGSSQVNPKNLISFFEAANEGNNDGDIDYAQGYSLHSEKESEKRLLDAVDLASTHDTVLLFLGLPPDYESEGFDRKNMRLPEEQYVLFEALYKVNKNIVVVLSLGSPVELPFAEKAKAIVVSYLAGEAGGEALRNLLLGKKNFSGKFAETWPVHYLDVPSYEFFPGKGNSSLYKESVFVGYRYYLTAKKYVQFPFGFGLSYTSFAYSEITLSSDSVGVDTLLSVTMKVKNTGAKTGQEIVQLYVSQPSSKTFKPLRELKAFQKVFLEPGQEKTIIFSLPYSSFAVFDATSGRDEAENGTYRIEIGASSSDIRLSKDVNVVSLYKGCDRRDLLPDYYALTHGGVFHVSDEEFQVLLGHPIPVEKDRHTRPFTLNSTLEEISRTFVGKIVVKKARKQVWDDKKTQEANDDVLAMVLNSPIRMTGMGGFSDRILLTIVDLANMHFLKAAYDYFFGKRK